MESLLYNNILSDNFTRVFYIIKFTNSEGTNIINERVSSINIDRADESIDERLVYSAAVKSISKNPVIGLE